MRFSMFGRHGPPGIGVILPVLPFTFAQVCSICSGN
jgi:hypothetical protein